MDSDGTAGGFTIGENITQTFANGTILTKELATASPSIVSSFTIVRGR